MSLDSLPKTEGIEYRDLSPFGFPGYCIGNNGELWSLHRGQKKGRLAQKWHRMKGSNRFGKHAHRHPQTILVTANGAPKAMFIHRLVLFAFVGPCPPGMEARHLDDSLLNNNLDNLCWGTHLENMLDINRLGHRMRGEQMPASKLTENDVREIRRLLAEGKMTQHAIARQFEVSHPTVHGIKTRKYWNYLD